jgi:hypothetical protein
VSLEAKITRLEARLGAQSTKHYLCVRAFYRESKEVAINRYLRERGITMDDVGCMWAMGDDFCESIDFKNYARKEELIGYQQVTDDIGAWMNSEENLLMSPSTTWLCGVHEKA